MSAAQHRLHLTAFGEVRRRNIREIALGASGPEQEKNGIRFVPMVLAIDAFGGA